ncbi:carbohydrate kinase [Luteibacter jiangsuensis]|uniref:Carbohydrate kinase n=1 Tax=Luteibacter jiangsuensis TaxID=637577 RepID=A0ABX0Q8R2_9GAMM|nr:MULTISPECIES: carbohydrate kinase [Luteibacter]NID05578.1 carbohydrate kinase [Luteibacter jiangsuensis]NII52774.1 fructokinase [Luteibacter sp. SG786]
MSSILCFGEALIDFHAQPQGGAGQPPAFVPFAGGAPANVAVAAARLGGKARFAGMLSRDMFGDFLLKSLTELGVGTEDIARTDEARTALAFVAHDEKGDRSFSFYRPPAADLLFRPEHFRPGAFDDLAVFHVCSNSLTEAAIAATTVEGMRRARAAGALVSFDMNLRPALWPKDEAPLPRLWETLNEADVIKLSAEEFAFIHAGAGSDDAVLERLWRGKARLLLVTDGPEPMRWFTRSARGTLQGYTVDAVDTTAAGDAFVGGLLARLAMEEVTPARFDALIADEARLVGLIRFAAAAGAITATHKGSFTAIPDQAEVMAFMEKHA